MCLKINWSVNRRDIGQVCELLAPGLMGSWLGLVKCFRQTPCLKCWKVKLCALWWTTQWCVQFFYSASLHGLMISSDDNVALSGTDEAVGSDSIFLVTSFNYFFFNSCRPIYVFCVFDFSMQLEWSTEEEVWPSNLI